jgi:DNA-binding MarR family transcriptional regulator
MPIRQRAAVPASSASPRTARKAAPRTRRRLAVSSFPVPPAEAVKEMERKLFSSRFVDEHLSALLGRAAMAISEEFHEDTRRYRMPIPHWRIMACLSDNPGMSLTELSELTLISQPTVTRLVQRLEAARLIVKSADGHDRRVLHVSLTARGRDRVRDLVALADARQERILAGLDAEALKRTLRYLIAFCAAKRRGRRAFTQMTF